MVFFTLFSISNLRLHPRFGSATERKKRSLSWPMTRKTWGEAGKHQEAFRMAVETADEANPERGLPQSR
jgi:hypothetical protein